MQVPFEPGRFRSGPAPLDQRQPLDEGVGDTRARDLAGFTQEDHGQISRHPSRLGGVIHTNIHIMIHTKRQEQPI